MKKVINGYIARTDSDEILFSDQPMRQGGFFGDDNLYYPEIETDEKFPVIFSVDMHKYMDIPELTEEDSPRRCTITIDVGEFVGKRIEPKFMQKKERIRHNCAVLAAETGRSFDEAKKILEKSMPEISKYLED